MAAMDLAFSLDTQLLMDRWYEHRRSHIAYQEDLLTTVIYIDLPTQKSFNIFQW